MTHSTLFYATPAGTLQIFKNNNDIYKAEFVSQEFSTKESSCLTAIESISFNFKGTTLQVKVWQALLTIPYGSTITYEELAYKVGYPQAWRAVANAVGKNPIAYLVPCHRVVRKDGSIGGYRWGTEKKELLLKAEQTIPIIP